MALGVAVVALVALTGRDALAVRDDLRKVSADLSALRSQLLTGDQQGARRTVRAAQVDARAAQRHTDGFGWWVSSKIPGVGRNVTAVRTVVHVSDDVTHRVLPLLVQASGSLAPDRLRPVGGHLDVAAIQQVVPVLTRADSRLSADASLVRAIRTDDLAPQIAGPVRLVRNKMVDASALTDRSARAARLLPPLLGSEGPRRYLLIFQNNAEARSTGGIPGSFAEVSAEDGKVRIVKQGSAQGLGKFRLPPAPLHSDERATFGMNLGRFAQDVTFTPDFPRTGRLAQAMWRAREHTKVDGVLSIDPVALSYVLRGTGPVRTPGGGRLSSANAVPVLLNKVYADIPVPEQQNVFFNTVAKNVFEAVASGRGNPPQVLRQLTAAVGERRILFWSDRPREQRLVAQTALGGVLQRRPTRSPQVGVFLNDGGASKLDYYLHYRVSAQPEACRGGRQLVRVTMHLRSGVPHDAAALPAYVRNHNPPSPAGLIRLNMFTYAPIGGRVQRFSVDGRSTLAQQRTHDGRTAILQRVTIRPGGERTMVWHMVSGVGQDGPLQLRVTPGVNGTGLGAVGKPAC